MPCCCTQICHLAQICWPPSAACPLPHHPSVAARSAAAGATLAEGRLEIVLTGCDTCGDASAVAVKSSSDGSAIELEELRPPRLKVKSSVSKRAARARRHV